MVITLLSFVKHMLSSLKFLGVESIKKYINKYQDFKTLMCSLLYFNFLRKTYMRT